MNTQLAQPINTSTKCGLQHLHSYSNVFLHLYKFSIQIKLNMLILSTYEECRMCINIFFHPKCCETSQFATYDHITTFYQGKMDEKTDNARTFWSSVQKRYLINAKWICWTLKKKKLISKYVFTLKICGQKCS